MEGFTAYHGSLDGAVFYGAVIDSDNTADIQIRTRVFCRFLLKNVHGRINDMTIV